MSAPANSGVKRSIADISSEYEEEQLVPNPKRTRLDTGSMSGLIAQVAMLETMPHALENQAWLNAHDFEQLFPDADEDTRPMVQLANRVYEASISGVLQSGQIGLNSVQQQDLRRHMFGPDENSIAVARFGGDAPVASSARIRVDLLERPTVFGLPACLTHKELTDAFREAFNEKVLTKGQTLMMNSPCGPLKVTISDVGRADIITGMGRCTGVTHLTFTSKARRYLRVVDLIPDHEVQNYRLRIRIESSPGGAWYQGTGTGPLVLDADMVKEDISYALGDRKLGINQSVRIRHEGWVYSAELEEVNLYWGQVNSDNEPVFDLSWSEEKMKLLSSDGVLIQSASSESIFPASNVTFCIVSYRANQDDGRHVQRHVGVVDLATALREELDGETLIVGQRVVAHTDTGKYLLEVQRFNPITTENAEAGLSRKSCHFYYDTVANLQVAEGLNLNLVDDTVLHPLEELSFEVSQKVDERDALLQALFGGGKPESVEIDESELRALVTAALPEEIGPKEELTISFKGKELLVKVTNRKVVDDQAPEVVYDYLGAATENTSLKFEATKEGGVNIQTELQMVDYDHLDEEIRKLGLGGLASQFKKIVRDIISSRGPLRKIQQRLGIKPPRGLLLYGPPGTGKTTLARGLGKLLGCSGTRLQLLAAPEIWNKYVGESEKKIRELFRPAREAAKKKGDAAPLYVIVVDEIEAILGKRTDDSKSWEKGVVDQFLGELDGLNALNNILVVGMTNHKDLLDPAMLRSGRFDTQIELALPDVAARQEIFDIHLEKLKKNNMIASDVDMARLIDRTDGYSGAHIEGVVAKATRIMLDRIRVDLGEQPEDLTVVAKSSKAQVTMEDFMEAIEEIGVRRPEEEPPYGRIPDRNMVGVVNALYFIRSGGGGLNHIQVTRTEAKEWDTFQFTGTLGKTTKEAIKAAMITAWNLLDADYVKELRSGTPFGLHIHYPGMGTTTDGPSAGCALTLAILSAITNVPIRRDVAMTGECDIFGNALPIGGLEGKLPGAKRAGASLVLIPESNRRDFEKLVKKKTDLVDEDFDVVTVRHMHEVVKHGLVKPIPLIANPLMEVV